MIRIRGHILTDRIWKIQPTPELIQLLYQLEGDEILSGPERDRGTYEIDDIFAGGFQNTMDDLIADLVFENDFPAQEDLTDGTCAAYLWEKCEILMEDPANGVFILGHDFGSALILNPDPQNDPKIVGLYWGVSLVINPESGLLGKGYGRDLALSRLLMESRYPTWWLDTPAYSRAGAAAHLSGFVAAREMASEIDRDAKKDRLDENTFPSQ